MEQPNFDKLKIASDAFLSLLDTQYHIIIGRKGKSVDLTIEFNPIDFHHLMGLGKLKDLRIATQNRKLSFLRFKVVKYPILRYVPADISSRLKTALPLYLILNRFLMIIN